MSRIALLALLSTLVGIPLATPVDAVEAATPEFATPPRLSHVNGPVSFWRPATGTWQAAALNTPLAPGDALATSERANAEVQFGARAWLRAANGTEISLTTNLPELTALGLATGVASVDVRGLAPGRMVEIVTPHATLFIRDPGYYRIATSAESTRVTVRRGGQAQLRSAAARLWTLQAGEEVLVHQADPFTPQLFAAPAEDEWDRWNISRSDSLGSNISARHVSPEVYGLAELDRHGTWQHDGPYGPVWIPAALPAGWTPYGAGRWIEDPVFGQTWLDDAPWGYAPFHYGRWIDLGGTWAWAPGPRLARPAYAPALVGWISDRGVQAGWVALGWGEPVLPWWGPAAFVGRPHWGGWGGPRVINHVVIGHHATNHDARAIRFVNQRGATVRALHGQGSFGARPDFRPGQPRQFTEPRNAPSDAGRARETAPLVQRPRPAPQSAQLPTPLATPAVPAINSPVVTPTAPAASRAAQVHESGARQQHEHRGRRGLEDAPVNQVPQPARPAVPAPVAQPAAPPPRPVQAQVAVPPAPLATRAESAPAAAPMAATIAAPAPAAARPDRDGRGQGAAPPMTQQMPANANPHPTGANRHEHRVEPAERTAPPPRAPTSEGALQQQPGRRAEAGRPDRGAGGPRPDGPRAESADRKPRQ